MLESEKNPEKFWDKRAATFPRYSGLADSYEVGMLALARANGVVFQGRRVLDVGCGSGMYTIGLALEAARVTALDISSEMLAVLSSEAEKWGLNNIRPVQGDWLSFESGESFDLIFCSMVPALRDDRSRDKLLAFAAATVVYIGWAAPARSDVMAGLYRQYGLDPTGMVDAPEMKKWLDGRGLSYRPLPVSGRWRVPFSLEQLRGNCLNTLGNHGLSPDPDRLDEYLAAFRQADGSYLETTPYEVEMLIF